MATDSLEQQALDRVARMYAGFDRRPQQRRPHEPEPAREPVHEPDPEARQPARETPAEEASQHPETPPKPPGLLDTLMEDKEQSLILLLLIILMKDGADLNLILALLYLVL